MLDDIRRALRMDSPAPRLSESNLRKLSRGLRCSKKSRLSVHSTLETNSVQDGHLGGGRSVSMSTLLPSGGAPGSVPRVDKLQTLEAKMANIEMSLGWRRRREALLETLPRAARDLVRELDSLHQSVREKDSCIQGLRTQITNLGGTVTGSGEGGVNRMNEEERKAIEDRLEKVQTEVDSKKVTVKNLKLSLDKMDLTDNIDIRIRAAELEYELEREELNILNLKEEATILAARLQDTAGPNPSAGNANSPAKSSLVSLHELLAKQEASAVLGGASLTDIMVPHTPGNPPFHVIYKAPFGCVIDWATDDTRLKKGDRIVEVNRELVIGKEIDEVTKSMSNSSLLCLVVARPIEVVGGSKNLEKQLEEKLKENKELVAKLDKVLKEREALKNDHTRLNHRISYLEDQVNELQVAIQTTKEDSVISANQREGLTPSLPGATIIQVFQKGDQTMAVTETDLESSEDRVQEYPTLPRLKSPSCSSTGSGSTARVEDKESTKGSSSGESFSRSEKEESKDAVQESSPPPDDKSVTINYSINNRCDSMSPAGEYSVYGIVTSLKNDPSCDYDPIDQLHEKLSTKSPSYSYQSPINSSSEAQKCKPKLEDDCQRNKRHSRDSDLNIFEAFYGKIAKHCKAGKVNQANRPSGRSAMQSKHPLPETLVEPSKASRELRLGRGNVCERPPRKVLSPSGTDLRIEDSRFSRPRPVPPKKPERLSLQRTTSMLSVDDGRPCSRTSSASTPCKSYSNSHSYHRYGSDAISEDYSCIYSEERILGYRDDRNRRHTPRVSAISEERPSNPSSRLADSKVCKNRTAFARDPRRFALSTVDSKSVLNNPLSMLSSPYSSSGHFPSKSKSLDAALHLDSTLGLEYHHDARAQPLYEYLRRPPQDFDQQSTHSSSKSSLRKPLDRDGFQAPPTPNTPPRGLNFTMSNPVKNGEEWC